MSKKRLEERGVRFFRNVPKFPRGLGVKSTWANVSNFTVSRQNANWRKYKTDIMQIQQNANETKCNHDEMQIGHNTNET